MYITETGITFLCQFESNPTYHRPHTLANIHTGHQEIPLIFKTGGFYFYIPMKQPPVYTLGQLNESYALKTHPKSIL